METPPPPDLAVVGPPWWHSQALGTVLGDVTLAVVTVQGGRRVGRAVGDALGDALRGHRVVEVLVAIGRS